MLRFSEVADKINSNAIRLPAECPTCSSQLYFVDAYLVCKNPECPSKVKGRIHKFVVSLDIKNVGDQTIDQLVTLGHVSTPADLFEVTLAQFSQIDRKGAAHYKKMRAGLAARKRVTIEKFFGSLNITQAGEGTFISLVQAGFNSFKKIMAMTVAKAVAVPRVGEQAAKNIVEFLKDNKKDIARLKSHLEIQSSEGKKLEGKSFLFTGKANRPRSQLEAMVRDNGGIVSKSVSSTLSFLVCADPNSNSGKAKKARKSGVAMITEDDFVAMLDS